MYAKAIGQVLGGGSRAVLIFIGAVVTGFAIPAGWLRVGAEIQSKSGKGGQTFLAIGVIFAGIIGSYFAIVWATGLVAARRIDEGERRPRRYNWNRSLRDEAHKAPTLNPLESLFVWTAVLVGAAYMVWFFFFAGSSLPGGG
jgi:hypothetical protein